MNAHSLLPYQVEGAIWLAARRGGLLADQMRLGKSPQAIVACDAVDAERILVICPASARVNWAREFEKFSTRRRGTTIFSTGGARPPTGLTICSYDLAAKSGTNTLLRAVSWDVLIADEAHYLKTPDAQRTGAVYGKKGLVRSARRIWALTGTPAPNHVGELWTLLYTFGATPLGYWSFVERYCTTDGMGKVTGNNLFTLRELKGILNKVMLRRTKTEVLKDLPPIMFSSVVVAPSKVDIKRWFPSLAQHDLDAILDDQARAVQAVLDRDDAALCEVPVSTLRRYTALAKVPAVVEMLKDEFNGGLEKIVVFAYHREALTLLMEGLAEFKPVMLRGGMTDKQKQHAIDTFNNDPRCRVFVGQIQAAGVAIPLHAASEVLFVESSWVPSENEQAAARIDSILLKRQGFARFVGLAGSIDEAVQAVLRRKTKDLLEVFS